ncbi:GNAT family N-acetyltransferase [Caballeronia sp. LZ033]|uniref:GNAT family N-acetyltransferase n=1 Tax=Caballeronia sp. LZ033 TaxID=3038566 RepID=UPI0028622F66|nr:GNAT family N-acetyltransferase [Caballeronia sp. LZ033]MDR5814120.1 GNAT family N-acetyltransferase [Caballeronia sp. LZ033]
MSGAARVRMLSADEVTAYVEPLADVLIDCVEGGAAVSFMLPLARHKAIEFWERAASNVARGERVLLIAEDLDGRIVGTVQLITSFPENQPQRADVSKMLVRRDARRQGVAASLLAAVEDVAREAAKSVLLLDTETGSDAERLYERAGWQRVGEVPDCGYTPDGKLCGTTFFHKRLSPGAVRITGATRMRRFRQGLPVA